MKHLLTFLVVAAASVANAGISVRNGGQTLVCPRNDGSQNIWLLDYAEAALADSTFQLDLQLQSDGLNLLISRIAKYSPERAQAYAAKFTMNFVYAPLTPTNDPGPLAAAIPKECSIDQAAVQTPDPFNPLQLKSVLINNGIWAKMDPANQAGLYMHEILYRELLMCNAQNSAALRHFNAVLASTKMPQMSYREFVSLLSATGFLTYEYQGLPMTFVTDDNITHPPMFYPNGRLQKGTIVDFTYVKMAAGNNAGFTLSGETEFRDADHLSLVAATLAQNSVIIVGTKVVHAPAGSLLSFDANSNVVSVTPPSPKLR